MGAIATRRMMLAVAVLGLVAGAAGQARADLVLNATATGWYDQTGSHDSTIPNYIAGNDGSTGLTQYRDFFVFSLAGVTGTITGATLSIPNPVNGSSNITSQTYTAYDVSTSIATLTASNTGRTDIFNDLGTGTVYGSTSAPTVGGGIVSVTLDAAALAALNAAEGGSFASGGALAPLTGPNQYIFGFSGLGAPVQLTLTIAEVPELDPGSLAGALTLASGGLMVLTSRRRRAAA